MKKLFLTSTKIDLLPKLVNTEPEKQKVVFMPTAADPYSDKWFVEADRKKLKELGFNITELDLHCKTLKDFELLLRNSDILYVAGGNSFYLLQEMRKSGMDKILPELLSEGLFYVGSSAGAVVAGPNIEPVSLLDDASLAPDLISYEGLGLVDFVVLPHYGNEKYQKSFEKIMQKYSDEKVKIIPITDEQSIIIEGDDYKII